MAKNFSKMSLILWGGVLLAVLYFVFGMGRRTEGFASKSCSERKSEDGCKAKEGCTWSAQKCSIASRHNQQSCEDNKGTWTAAYCS